jgi:hypothetical protein
MASASAATIGNTRVMPPNVALIGAGLRRLEALEVTLVLVEQSALRLVDLTDRADVLAKVIGTAGGERRGQPDRRLFKPPGRALSRFALGQDVHGQRTESIY